VWRSLIGASPHGCRVHIGGGEPFGRWELLIDLCRRARSEGLAPRKVETNAFWATQEKVVRERLAALDDAGMEKLVISADPYHQQFVPIERCRLVARVAEEVLGPERLQVRWRDWLSAGFDTGSMSKSELWLLFSQYAKRGRDRLTGRAAEVLAGSLLRRPISEFRGREVQPCREALLRSKHVHVGPDGLVMPGVCAGIILGRLRLPLRGLRNSPALASAGQEHPCRAKESMASIWEALHADFGADGVESACSDSHPVLSELVRFGPIGLLGLARRAGFVPADGYAGKCHLCWEVRRFLAWRGLHQQELGPAWLYGLRSSGAGVGIGLARTDE
jgi:hypothetical protein